MTVMYWDFVARHRERLARYPRTEVLVRNLERFDAAELAAIRSTARHMRDAPDAL